MTKLETQSAKGLLPDRFEDFRSVEFWDGFFDARGDKPFEWYGDYRQLKRYFAQRCTADCEILVLGCGNSELSADLYDSGCERITNVDFSRKVIASMMAKHVRRRPKMKWKIADMTALKIADASFDVVIDKGGLDALMGEDSSEGSEAGRKLLEETSRVLRSEGSYLGVTLAQAHVLRLLLDTFRVGWRVTFDSIPPAPDMARAQLQPIFVSATKVICGEESLSSSLRPSPRAPNADQLAEICEMIDAHAEAMNGSAAENARTRHAQDDFDRLYPGRRVTVDIGGSPSPRFSATVLDASGSAAEAAVQQCGVFIVPQGRDTEWLFASEAGQWQIAGQCRCRRVILVVLNRGHDFGRTKAVQAELSPLVRPLAPVRLRAVDNAIPIMTTEEGVGERRWLESFDSTISGRIVVEDVALRDSGRTSLVRRMVFASNRNLVQSEAVLRPPRPPQPPPPGPKKKGKGAQKIEAERQLEGASLDLDVLSMAYHNCIVGGISLWSHPKPAQKRRALIVGLGAGGLAVFLHTRLGFEVQAVELDEAVVGLAQRHFGFRNSPGLEATVGDGIEAVRSLSDEKDASEALDVLVVDAGSGDASLAMSCPPPEFLEASFLRHASAALKPSGLLVLNCVTRLDSAFQLAVEALRAVFNHVYASEVEEDLNRVLFASKEPVASYDVGPKQLRGCVEEAMTGRSVSSEQVQAVLDDFSGLQLC